MAGTKPLLAKFAVEGLLLSSVSAPLEKARLLVLLQQLQHVPPSPQRVRGSPRPIPRLNKHEEVMQMLFKLAQQHGILSLWRGNLLRVIEYAGFFLLYRLAPRLERFVVRHERKDVWKFYSEQTLFGVLMHTAYFLLLSPLHLVATRLSVDIRKPNRYAGIIDCVTQTVKTEGVGGLYKGFGVRILQVLVSQISYSVLYWVALRLSRTPSFRLCVHTLIIVFVVGVLVYPLRIIQDLREMDDKQRWRSDWACLRDLLRGRSGCIRTLYTGVEMHLLSSLIGTLVLFLKDNYK